MTPHMEHAKGLRLAGRMWAGCTTFERLPEWLGEAAVLRNRDPNLEVLAEHIRHHLTNEMHRRKLRY